MKKHTKIYLKYFGYTDTDYIPCEVCTKPAVDIHHIEARGMGGSKKADTIENLQAVCRECHLMYGDKTTYIELLKDIHNAKLTQRKQANASSKR
tara:strand:+ start:1050 stop:1331 length:282 start_codon:yes stop_codon:yes gene_type:complete